MEKCPPNPFNQFFYGFDNFGFSSKFGDFHMDISVKALVKPVGVWLVKVKVEKKKKSFLLFRIKEKRDVRYIYIYKQFVLVGHGYVCVMSKP